VDGRPLAAPAAHRYVLLHKPAGYVTTRRDPEGRPVVMDLLPPALRHLAPVGRLDVDTEGLLLLTNDGELANRLLHPRYQIPRVYHAEVRGQVSRADLPRWRRGVLLEDGPAAPQRVELRLTQRERSRLALTFAEGRKREVRRYCAALGHPVLRLTRIAFGPLSLRGLRAGAHRSLAPDEVAELKGLHRPGDSHILHRIRR
jgi:23S rRNA pseudouridine2605 synthase